MNHAADYAHAIRKGLAQAYPDYKTTHSQPGGNREKHVFFVWGHDGTTCKVTVEAEPDMTPEDLDLERFVAV